MNLNKKPSKHDKLMKKHITKSKHGGNILDTLTSKLNELKDQASSKALELQIKAKSAINEVIVPPTTSAPPTTSEPITGGNRHGHMRKSRKSRKLIKSRKSRKL